MNSLAFRLCGWCFDSLALGWQPCDARGFSFRSCWPCRLTLLFGFTFRWSFRELRWQRGVPAKDAGWAPEWDRTVSPSRILCPRSRRPYSAVSDSTVGIPISFSMEFGSTMRIIVLYLSNSCDNSLKKSKSSSFGNIGTICSTISLKAMS